MRRSRTLLAFGAVVAFLAGSALAGPNLGEPVSPRFDDCCCVVVDGELVCTITGEVLEECCCK